MVSELVEFKGRLNLFTHQAQRVAIGPCHQCHVDETQAIITSSTPPHQISTTTPSTPATTSAFNDNIIAFGLQIFPSKPTYFTRSVTNTGDPHLRSCGESSW
ncbi:hypothetical protein MTR_3g056260 [Medicago truncatula]|uniref:Uncharacterized protein n=1 Tax=Medicago truncatula TaxID=3880 RepID=G7J221_MEDTR|nr:hypothetical protein MTR_3g056260 [Medicago truncatula]